MTMKLPAALRPLAVPVLALAVLSACSVPAPRWNSGAAAVKVPADAVRTMADFDAVYIAALAASTAAATDAGKAAAARRTLDALQAQWTTQEGALLAAWGTPAPSNWVAAVGAADARIAAAVQAGMRPDWHAVHEELEEVRVGLREARVALGMDYFVDRLTAYHAPMEQLALAGTQWKPGDLTPQRRAELERAWRQCVALWEGIERFSLDPAAYGLAQAGWAQLQAALAQERQALQGLGAALADSDDAALLRAAAGVKPPFARAFTAFARSQPG